MRNPESHNRLILNDISFNLHKGEVLGIYGLMGAGRTELLECLFGLHPKLITGQIYVNGSPASIKHPSDAVNHGIALCPEDRKREGLVLGMSIRKNVTLAALKKITKYADVIRHRKERSIADEYRQRLAIKSYSAEQLAEQLSGGNQQKIVLGKWMMTQPKILFLDEPTRGIDINAKHEIYHLIDQMAAQGIAVIVVSSELPEIMAVSDRIITMRQGRIGNCFLRSEFTEESILKASLPQ
jgi:ribose transport system ATP-binding protein